MNKFKKILSALAVTIAFTTLASCGENSFYKEWHDAGATIEEENVFKELGNDYRKNGDEYIYSNDVYDTKIIIRNDLVISITYELKEK